MRPVAGRARRLIQGALTFVALLAGGATLFALLARDGDGTVQMMDRTDDRGYYLTDATLTELAPDGRARVIVRARSIEEQLADESVRMRDLVMDYSTPRAGEWHVTAERGTMPRERTTLQLAGNVRVSGSPDAKGGRALILTEELNYDTKANVIDTSAPVAVQFGTHHINGRGLHVALNDRTLRLESNVNGTFTP